MSAPITVAPAGTLMFDLPHATQLPGITIEDDVGEIVVPRTTSGVVEVPAGSGNYIALITAPGSPGSYVAVWDTGIRTPFTVAVTGEPAAVPESVRALAMSRQPSRIWLLADQSINSRLVDAAYLLRSSATPVGSDDGTPVYTQGRYGPYACRLSQPDLAEQRDPDRFVETATHTLLISIDLEPVEGDYYAVTVQDPSRDTTPYGVEKVYRVLSGIAPRTPPWRAPALWHVPVAITREH